MDLKTIALDARPAVAKRKEFNRGTNDGLREGRPPQTLEKNIGRVPVQRRILWLLGGLEWSFWRTGHCPNPKWAMMGIG